LFNKKISDMQKLSFIIVLTALFFTSCTQEDRLLDRQENITVEAALPQSSVHPSMTESSWWQHLPSFTKEMHTLELSAEENPITYEGFKKIQREKIDAVRALYKTTRKPKVSPGYPTPNPEGNVVLNSQADVDAFGAQKYKEITGHLEIDDTGNPDPICDLSPLKRVRKVGSYLIISASCVTDLDGLKKINSVGMLGPFGYIAVRCENVTDIDALKNINTITGSINIITNLNLISIGKAFNKITSIESGKTAASITSSYVLNINGNTVLADLGGLENLATIERNLLFNENDAITDLDGFTALNSIGNLISIENNDNLQNVNKLSVITFLSTGLIVQDNPALTECCGLYSLVCSNPPVCDVPGVGVAYIILNNGSGCTDVDIISNGPC
jgi:hypothetical protein